MDREPAAEERIAPVKREYTAYPRQFQSWRWYKPIFVLLLFAAFYPLESGLPCPRAYAQHLRWFKWYNY